MSSGTLPRDVARWESEAPEAWEELKERAALVWEGDSRSTEADWPAAKRAAIEMVRRRHNRGTTHSGYGGKLLGD